MMDKKNGCPLYLMLKKNKNKSTLKWFLFIGFKRFGQGSNTNIRLNLLGLP